MSLSISIVVYFPIQLQRSLLGVGRSTFEISPAPSLLLLIIIQAISISQPFRAVVLQRALNWHPHRCLGPTHSGPGLMER